MRGRGGEGEGLGLAKRGIRGAPFSPLPQAPPPIHLLPIENLISRRAPPTRSLPDRGFRHRRRRMDSQLH